MIIKIKKLQPDLDLPAYAHPDDAGLDLYSLEDYELKPNEIKRFDFGFALELPAGYAAIAFDRSSMGAKGIHNLGGLFDAGYRGEYNCHLINLTTQPYQIKKGDKICQLIIFPVVVAEWQETDSLAESSRGDNRLGSTGQ
jgi:dUTP pyrophosphatase